MNKRLLSALCSLFLAGLSVLVFAGCPTAPDAILALIVSPNSLEFGDSQTALTLQVRKNYTSVPLSQFRVTSNVPWLSVSPATGTSSGPEDPVTVTVTLDRNLLSVGINQATLSITAVGASQVSVPVTAIGQIGASFTASTNAAFTEDEVQFTDLSQVAAGAPPIDTWEWDFGDGTTSTEQNPVHAYTTPGSFDVTLTVSNGEQTGTLTRNSYVSVRSKVPPTADFAAAQVNAFPAVGIKFTDLSTPGTSPITSYAWDFGDGSTSTADEPTHAYALPGTYSVSLTVETDHGTDTETKQNYITISARGPEAAFSSDVQQAVIGATGALVRFTDESVPGTYPLQSWFWEFGDGDTSTEIDPLHAYQDPGSYSVSLTVTAQNGQMDTVTVTNFIRVVENTITANFTANVQNADVGQTIRFTDTSNPGPSSIIQWLWDFGDGTSSQMQNPTHAYSEVGLYTVSLTVINAYGSDAEVKTDYIDVSPTSVLKRYIRDAGSPSYSVETVVPFPYGGQVVTFHVLDLKSQNFRPGEIVPSQWQHWMIVITPAVVTSDTALLVVSGGSNKDTFELDPTDLPSEALVALEFVAQTGAVAVLLPTVPNQPLVFHGDGVNRTEDEAIAYTYDQYLNGGDEYWPLLLPMTKSAVSAMDVAQLYTAGLGLTVQDFVVTGASKRGWTTWLTGIADERVIGIAPIVIDVLNMRAQMNYHKQAYNGYSSAVQDYVDFNVFDRFGTERGQELLKIVDPYSYLSSLEHLPKLLLNSTGDQFFLPDSAQFYVHDLPGETRIRYLPNTDHGLEQGPSILDLADSLMSFFLEVADDEQLPTFSWEVIGDNQLVITTDDAYPPTSVELWTGTVSGATRDFRFHTVGAIWSSQPLTDPDGDGVYVATVPTPIPANTWTGFFANLTFNNNGVVHTFSTELRVTPDTMPYGPSVLRVDIDATGDNDGSSWANAFNSIQDAIDEAVSEGINEIWVAEGTYNEAIELEDNIALYGGFDGTEYGQFERDFEANPTIIDGSIANGGQPANHVVYLHTTVNARIDGFSITGGDASGVVPDDWPDTAGGGIYCGRIDETNVIANCRIYGNSADDSGGGIACVGYRGGTLDECNPTIENCIITDNYGGLGAGGIVCIVGASPTITNTIFADNSCTGVPGEAGGAGIGCADASSPTFANCIVANNSTPTSAGGAGVGSAVWGGNCNAVFINTIFSGNDDVAVYEGTADSDVTLTNCLFYDNENGDVKDENATIYTGSAQINANIAEATNCVSGDPKYINAANGDFRVEADSPAVDHGTAVGAPGTAIDGTTRPQGAAHDIGAYEQ